MRQEVIKIDALHNRYDNPWMSTHPERQLSVGQRIRAIRRAKRLTQRDVAARTGLAEPFLSRIENERAEPSLGTLNRLATALEISLGDLLGVAQAQFRPSCPVSHSGRCIAELIYQPGPRPASAEEHYTARQIRLLRLANYLVQCGAPATLDALETVMRGMVKLPDTRRDWRKMQAITKSAVGGQQSAVGSQQAAVRRQQSAVENRQSSPA